MAVTAAAIGVAAVVPAGAKQGGNSSEAGRGAVRALTARYADPADAVADGFAPTDECVPEMGFHYVNFARFDGRVKASRPEALIYHIGPGGERELVGAEYLAVDADQNLATDDDRPSVFGHELEGPMPGHSPGMPIHYDLHAYAWLANPDGTFATWNANVNCGP